MVEAEQEPQTEFIDDINREAAHYLRNPLTAWGTYLQLRDQGRKDLESEGFVDRAEEDKNSFFKNLDWLIKSEFEPTAIITKENLTKLRELAETIDWNNTTEFEELKSALEDLLVD